MLAPASATKTRFRTAAPVAVADALVRHIQTLTPPATRTSSSTADSTIGAHDDSVTSMSCCASFSTAVAMAQ